MNPKKSDKLKIQISIFFYYWFRTFELLKTPKCAVLILKPVTCYLKSLSSLVCRRAEPFFRLYLCYGIFRLL